MEEEEEDNKQQFPKPTLAAIHIMKYHNLVQENEILNQAGRQLLP